MVKESKGLAHLLKRVISSDSSDKRVKGTCLKSTVKKTRKEGNNPFPILFALGGYVLSSSSIHSKEEENKLNSGTPSHPCCESRFDQLLSVLLPISNYFVLVQNPHLFNLTELYVTHFPITPELFIHKISSNGLQDYFPSQT